MTIFDRREKSAERVREEHISIDDAVVRNFSCCRFFLFNHEIFFY
jgi:hypothetical protein